jgi:hypothetical protein
VSLDHRNGARVEFINAEPMAKNTYEMRKSGLIYEDIARDLGLSIASRATSRVRVIGCSDQNSKSRIMIAVHKLLRADQ